MEKGQIAHCEQFFLFPQCWQTRKNQGLFGKGLNLYATFMNFNDPHTEEPFANIVGKGKNAGDQHFLLFPQCFLPFPN